MNAYVYWYYNKNYKEHLAQILKLHSPIYEFLVVKPSELNMHPNAYKVLDIKEVAGRLVVVNKYENQE